MMTGKLKGRILDMFETWRQARHEKHFILGISRKLLAQYQKISAEHPQSSVREQFKLLLMAYNNSDENAAYEVLKYAEESYATWPLVRELTLCDVIHYLAVREYHTITEGEYLMGGNVGSSVKTIVPGNLCRARLKPSFLSERRNASRCRSL